MNLQTFPDFGATVPKAPFVSPSKRRVVPGLAADEPDRTGMLIAVSFVLITLLSMTLALGYSVLIS